MTAKVFIDGEAGTTGLQIQARLKERRDLSLLTIDAAYRKDPAARADVLNAADLVILCLPDEAAREAVALIKTPSVKVIDASTAHRVEPAWVYGFPECAPGRRAEIAEANRVANPGCWSTGAIGLLAPLVRGGLVPADWPVTISGVSGYSGGGKSMIAEFEQGGGGPPHRIYATGLEHKHVPEIAAQAGLTHRPLFAPAVGRYYKGMIVEIPLQLSALPAQPQLADIHDCLADAYAGQSFIEMAKPSEAAALTTLAPEGLNGTNQMRLHVFGSERHRQARLVALLDNLGKGASGAAVQNLNLMLGLPETAGLV